MDWAAIRLKRSNCGLGKKTLFPAAPELDSAINDIYHYPLQASARDTLNRQMRSGITDDELAKLVMRLRDENMLCHVQEEVELQEPEIICSLGIFEAT
jgi:hypothetical protein